MPCIELVSDSNNEVVTFYEFYYLKTLRWNAISHLNYYLRVFE